MISKRAEQPAFHPNAAQFPLHLGDKLFGLRRESRSEGAPQTLLAIYNFSAEKQTLPLAELNLDTDRRWFELLSGAEIVAEQGSLLLPAYGYCWLAC